MQNWILFESEEIQRKFIQQKFDAVAKGHTGGLYGYRIDPKEPAEKKVIEFHNGLDLGTPEGTPLCLPIEGIVAAKWNDKGTNPKYPNGLNGNAIRIDLVGNEDVIARISFAHLQRWSELEVGKKYPAKTVFAFTGNTGASTGPHVHCVWWVQDDRGSLKTVDPLPYLARGLGFAEIPVRSGV